MVLPARTGGFGQSHVSWCRRADVDILRLENWSLGLSGSHQRTCLLGCSFGNVEDVRKLVTSQ